MKVQQRGPWVLAFGMALASTLGCEDDNTKQAGGPGTVPADYPKSSQDAFKAQQNSAPKVNQRQAPSPKPGPAPAK